jgi:hypothetical protein
VILFSLIGENCHRWKPGCVLKPSDKRLEFFYWLLCFYVDFSDMIVRCLVKYVSDSELIYCLILIVES